MSSAKDMRIHAEMEAVELAVARLLRVGVAIAGVLIAIGLFGLLTGLMPSVGTSLVTTGLLVLVLTPIMRVAGALWVFVREKDFIYASFSLFVLLVLALGVFLGGAEGH